MTGDAAEQRWGAGVVVVHGDLPAAQRGASGASPTHRRPHRHPRSPPPRCPPLQQQGCTGATGDEREAGKQQAAAPGDGSGGRRQGTPSRTVFVVFAAAADVQLLHELGSQLAEAHGCGNESAKLRYHSRAIPGAAARRMDSHEGRKVDSEHNLSGKASCRVSAPTPSMGSAMGGAAAAPILSQCRNQGLVHSAGT